MWFLAKKLQVSKTKTATGSGVYSKDLLIFRMAMISQKLPDMYINIFVTIIFCSYLNTSNLNCSDFSNIFSVK